MGRKTSLNLYGLPDVLDRVKKLMALFDWETWEGFYPINFMPIYGKEGMTLIDSEQITILGAEVRHLVPTIGIRLSSTRSVLCYSSDTEPCKSVLRLAKGADILIHEATGEGRGHTSPEQAGQVAQQSGVTKLYLIHYPADADIEEWVSRAKSSFSGDVVAARDLMTIEFP